MSFIPLIGQIPQFGYCDEVDMGQLVRLRSSLKDRLLEKGVKFSYMPVIVKALSLALLEYPMLNAHVNPECTAVTYKADHNIGIAMDTPDGLIVPNVKRVQVRAYVYRIAGNFFGFIFIIFVNREPKTKK